MSSIWTLDIVEGGVVCEQCMDVRHCGGVVCE